MRYQLKDLQPEEIKRSGEAALLELKKSQNMALKQGVMGGTGVTNGVTN